MSRKRRNKAYSVEEIRRRHARAYAQWTAEEDDELRSNAHLPIRTLAKMFERNRGAIGSRLKKLGLTRNQIIEPISEPAERVTNAEPAAADWPTIELVKVEPREKPGGIAIPRMSLLFFLAGLVALVIVTVALTDREPSSSDAARPAPFPLPKPHMISVGDDSCFWIATWNIRGYPEKRADDTEWFHRQLRQLGADVLCLQEIANSDRLAELLRRQPEYARQAFTDSGSGQDNAILTAGDIGLEELDGENGFQHAPRSAFVTHRGFDAVLMTVHLSWEPVSRRFDEMRLLEPFVADMLRIDPDVMIVGDFNLPPTEVHGLAEHLGMKVLMARNQETIGTMQSGRSYDYFLISTDLADEEAQGATVVEFEAADLEIAWRVSDHRPVLAYFACDERFRDRPGTETDHAAENE